ncbi:MAG: excinuclease ABC subunit UvrA, partial [Myxococcota bacterium]|nr:excinuclease ABC subunit UvrA [Myxococcota bacterium]
MDREIIRVVGAREHNLKGIDLVVPRETLTVFTGVSGSGKSSLAFDTIFQEGQRRFLQSLSSYARQFLGSMEKPAVDSIEGLSPAISIDQKRRGRNPRSTVGTVTEIHDHLRLLFARLGTPHCPDCGHPIQARSPAEIATRLLAAGPGQRVLVLAPVIQDRKGEYRKEFKGWLADGYLRARVDGELVRLEQPPELDRYVRHTIELVLDRLVLAADGRNRLVEAVERAVGLTGGLVAFLRDTGEEEVHELHATAKACPGCGFSLPELEPRLFSFNSPHGACPSCEGIGLRHRPAPARIIPDPSRPLVGGAIACLTAEGKMPFVSFDLADIAAVARGAGQDPATPWRRLPASLRRLILEGSDGRLVPHRYAVPGDEAAGEVLLPCRGVLPALTLAWGWTRASFLERWFDIGPCPDCDGTRLKREARAVKLGGRDLGQVGDLTVEELARWVEALPLAPGLEQAVGGPLVREVLARAGFLQELGLGYLTLGRGAATLAGGEFQRIRLARQLGSHLQGVLYVLDEPSIGLHPQDNQRLIRTLEKLRDDGNTVLVVEHDEETLRAADHLVELGPDAGERGGWLVAQGTPRQVAAADTHSGRLLAGREIIPLPAARRPPDKGWLTLRNARQHNLQGIDVAIPLGVLTVVTGVSGSGKSTLVDLTLRRALAQRFHGAEDPPGLHDGIDGLEQLDKVIEIDQDPIGRTPRSNPATYVKLFDGIRDLFADLPEARARGYQKGRFSFNVKGGRCEECQGAGVKEIELQLLAPVAVPCEVCEGRRFNAETLQIRYRGKTITDVLEMTVEEARGFFGHHPGLARTLDTLLAVGLGYLRLGQPSTTLSGGEAQRVKLAAELRRPATGRTLYLLDEPTTGLHAHDVQLLLTALQQLVDAGNTVLVVEHDLDVIKVADHLIDLGPGGGAAGGRIVAQGTPEEVAADPTSLTGQALAAALRQARATPPPAAAARVAEAAVPYAAKAARVAAAV